MRRLVVILILQQVCFNTYGQHLKSEDLINEHFYVEGFNSPLPLYFEKGDTLTLRNGIKFEAFIFSKKGKLKVVESYQWCGTTGFCERIKNAISGSVKYNKTREGTYQIDTTKETLFLAFSGDEYFCAILCTEYDYNELKTLKIVVKQKNPRQSMLRR